MAISWIRKVLWNKDSFNPYPFIMIDNQGKLEKEPDGYKVTFDRVYNHPVQAVWDAITNPTKLELWFMKVKMDFVAGGAMTIYFGDADNTESHAEIVSIDKEKRFEYIWKNEDGPDEHALWELFPVGENKCRLILTYSRISESYAINVSAGWHMMMNHLEEVLNGRTEPFPAENGKSEESIKMVKIYKQVWDKEFAN